MTDRWEVGSFKKTQSGKTFFVRLGSALPSKNGEGWQIYLDAIPAPTDGQYVMSITKPRDKQGGGTAPF